MTTCEKTYGLVLGVDPVRDPQTGNWQLPDQVHACLTMVHGLWVSGAIEKIVVAGDRAIRQDWLPKDIEWHPDPECRMGTNYLADHLDCPPHAYDEEPDSRDTPSNLALTVRKFVTNRRIGEQVTRFICVVPPAREKHVDFLGDRIVRPHCDLEVITADWPSTPQEYYNREFTRIMHQRGFADIPDGDLDGFEKTFYDSPMYDSFRFIDEARYHEEQEKNGYSVAYHTRKTAF